MPTDKIVIQVEYINKFYTEQPYYISYFNNRHMFLNRFFVLMFSLYFIDYELRNDSYCYPPRDPIDQALSEAKNRCNVDPLYAMLYDDGGRGRRFRLCNYDAATQPSGAGSRVYIKQGNRRVVLYHCTTNVETIYDLRIA